MRVTEEVDDAGQVVSKRYRFWRMLEITFEEAKAILECQEVKQRWVRLRDGDLSRLSARRGPSQSVIGGGVNAGDVARFAEFDHWNASRGVA